jgi:hypothetical protein
MCAYCYTLEGEDTAALASPAAPAFASAQAAGEMVEDYWQALTRDVPFSQYGTDPTIGQAVADLNKLTDYRGPKVNGRLTPDVITGDWYPTRAGPSGTLRIVTVASGPSGRDSRR